MFELMVYLSTTIVFVFVGVCTSKTIIDWSKIKELQKKVLDLENGMARLQQQMVDKKHIEKLKHDMPRVNL